MSLADREARSRQELACPSCRTEGLERFDAFAGRYDDTRKALIHGTRCSHCDQRVPPEKVEQQLASPNWSLGGLSIPVPNCIQNPPKRKLASVAGVVVFLAMFFLVPAAVGPFLGGAQAGAPPQGGTAVYADGNWTIYQNDGNYYVYNGQTDRFLTPTGPAGSPYYYNSESVARDVLDSYLSYRDRVANGTANGTFEFAPNGSQSTQPPSSTPTWAYNSSASNSSTRFSYQTPAGGYRYQTPSSGDGSNGPTYETPSDSGGSSGPTYQTPSGGSQSPGEEPPLHGRVIDENGEPVAGATVTVDGAARVVTANESGYYALSTPLPYGTFEVSAARDGISTPPTTLSADGNGGITVDGSPQHVAFVEESDGTLTQNRLQLVMPAGGDAPPIRLSGNGSQLRGTIRFANVENADTVQVNLSAVETTTVQRRTIAASDETQSLRIDGNADPADQRLLLHTSARTRSTQYSGTSHTSFSIPNEGNVKPTDLTIIADGQNTTQSRALATRSQSGPFEVTVAGTKPATGVALRVNGTVETAAQPRTTTYKTVSPGDSVTQQFVGTHQPKWLDVTITGTAATKRRQVSRTGTGTVTNYGNVDAEATLAVNGTTTDLGTQTKSGTVGDGESVTITVDGEVPAENVSLELTGGRDVTQIGGDSAAATAKMGSTDRTDALFYAQTDGTYIVDYAISASARKADGGKPKTSASTELEVGGDKLGRVAVYCGLDCSSYRDDAALSEGEDRNVTVEMNSGDAVAVDLHAWSQSNNFGPRARAYGSATVYRVDGPGTTSVRVDGSHVSTVSIGADQTKTINVGTLEPGTHTVRINTESGAGADYTASWDEQSAPTDIAVDTDADGTPELTHSDPLPEGHSVQQTVTLSPGTTTVDVTHNGPTPTWTGSFTQTNATENPTVDINDDGRPEVQIDDIIRDGESRTVRVKSVPEGSTDLAYSATVGEATLQTAYLPQNTTTGIAVDVDDDGTTDATHQAEIQPNTTATIPLAQLAPGTQTVDVQASAGGLHYSLVATERAVTKNLTITHRNQTVCQQRGYVEGTTTCTVPASTLRNQGSYQFNVSADGEPINYTAQYDARFLPESATVHIESESGQQTLRYPFAFNDDDGILRPTTPAQTGLSALGTGLNSVSVSTQPVKGVTPTVSAEFVYHGDRMVTRRPSVTVINGNGGVNSTTVPRSQLRNGYLRQNATLDLPARWFTAGENTIQIETSDGSVVEANVTARGVYRQTRTLTEGA